MSLKIVGSIYKIGKTKNVSKTGEFFKREFAIKTEDKFPQLIKMELLKDKCSILDNFNVGQPVTVYFNLNGREWHKDGHAIIFTTIQAWKIEKETQSAPTPPPPPPPSQSAPVTDDDLPF